MDLKNSNVCKNSLPCFFFYSHSSVHVVHWKLFIFNSLPFPRASLSLSLDNGDGGAAAVHQHIKLQDIVQGGTLHCVAREMMRKMCSFELWKSYDCITMDDGCNILLMDFLTNNVSR